LGKITRTFLLGPAWGAFEQRMTASRSATDNRVLVYGYFFMGVFGWPYFTLVWSVKQKKQTDELTPVIVYIFNYMRFMYIEIELKDKFKP